MVTLHNWGYTRISRGRLLSAKYWNYANIANSDRSGKSFTTRFKPKTVPYHKYMYRWGLPTPKTRMHSSRMRTGRLLTNWGREVLHGTPFTEPPRPFHGIPRAKDGTPQGRYPLLRMAPPLPGGQIITSDNITFPQLSLRAVTTVMIGAHRPT